MKAYNMEKAAQTIRLCDNLTLPLIDATMTLRRDIFGLKTWWWLQHPADIKEHLLLAFDDPKGASFDKRYPTSNVDCHIGKGKDGQKVVVTEAVMDHILILMLVGHKMRTAIMTSLICRVRA